MRLGVGMLMCVLRLLCSRMGRDWLRLRSALNLGLRLALEYGVRHGALMWTSMRLTLILVLIL